MKKRILSGLLVVLMLLTMLPTGAFAAELAPENGQAADAVSLTESVQNDAEPVYETVNVYGTIGTDKETKWLIHSGKVPHGTSLMEYLDSQEIDLEKTDYVHNQWYKYDAPKYKFPEDYKVTGWTNVMVQYTKLETVQLVIYRNGDVEKPYKVVPLPKLVKGDTLDVSALDINDYYGEESKHGFQFEGWYNDGGWNTYKKGDASKVLPEEITIRGWTNIVCMVKDQYPAYAMVYADGDLKTPAVKEFLGYYTYGTSYVDILEEHDLLNSLDSIYTPKNMQNGYEWDQKWWHEISNYGKPWGGIENRTVIGHTNLCAVVRNNYPAYAFVYTNGTTDVEKYAAKEYLGLYPYGTPYTAILEEHGYLNSLDGLYTPKNEEAGYEWDQKWWHELSNYGTPWGGIETRTVIGHTNLVAVVYNKYPAYAMVYTNGTKNVEKYAAKEFLGYYAYGTPYTEILEEHGYLTSLEGLYTPKDEKAGYEWDQKWWHELSNYGKPWGEIGERTVIGHTNLCAMVYTKYPVYAKVYRDGDTSKPANSKFLGYYAYGTTFASVLEEHGYLDSLEGLYTPNEAADHYEWDKVWSHEASNLGKPIGDRKVSGWSNLCTMVYDAYPVHYYIGGENVYSDTFTAKDLETYTFYTPEEQEGYTFDGWYESETDIGQTEKKTELPLTLKAYDLYGAYQEIELTIQFWLTENAAWYNKELAADQATVVTMKPSEAKDAVAATAVLSDPDRAFVSWNTEDGAYALWGGEAMDYFEINDYADENNVINLYASFQDVDVMLEEITVNFWLTNDATWADGTASDAAKTFTLIAGNSKAAEAPAATALESPSNLAFVEWAGKDGEPTVGGKHTFSYWSLAPYADENGVVDLYAVFEEVTVVPDTPITVNFHLTEGKWVTGGTDVISFTMVAGFKRFTAPAATAIDSEPTRAFDCWASENGLVLDGKEDFNYWNVCGYAVDGVVDLYARFEDVAVMHETLTVNFWLTNDATWADGTAPDAAKTFTLTAGNSKAAEAPAATAVLSAANKAFTEWAGENGEPVVDGKETFSYWSLAQYADENGEVNLYARFEDVAVMHETLTVNFWLTNDATWVDGTASDAAKTFTLTAGNSKAAEAPAATALESPSNLAFVEWAGKDGEPTVGGKHTFSYWSLAPYADENGVVDLYAVFEEVTVVPDTPITVNFHLTEGKWVTGGTDVISFTMVAGFKRFTAPAATAIDSDPTRAFDCWASENGLILDGKEDFNYWNVCEYAVDGVVDLYARFEDVAVMHEILTVNFWLTNDATWVDGTASDAAKTFTLTAGNSSDVAPAATALESASTLAFVEWAGKNGTPVVDGKETFSYWSLAPYADENGVVDLYAVFDEVLNTYHVTFLEGKHGELSGKTEYWLQEGEGVPAVPTVDADWLYAFTGWRCDADDKCYSTREVMKMKFYQDTVFTAEYILVLIPGEEDHVPSMLNGEDHYAYVNGYTDGTVKPEGSILRSEVAAMFFRLLDEDTRSYYLTKTNEFSDVEKDDWFNIAVSTMVRLEVITGYTDGTFRPNEPITRAEFAAICARFSEERTNRSCSFSDISRNFWAKDEIALAESLGWITGYTDGTFRPNQTITRAEAMAIVNRVLNRNPEDTDDLCHGMHKWPDNADVNKWYYLDVQEATNSHDYKRKNNGHEYWTEITRDPDWQKYE